MGMAAKRSGAGFLVAISLALCAALSPAVGQADCAAWMQSVGGYDAQVDRIIDGQEVEHLLTLLRRAQESAPDQRAESLPQLAHLVEARLEQLDEIDPPADLAPLHQKLIAFHRAVLNAAVRPAAMRVEASSASVEAPSERDRECYQTLLFYFEQLYDGLTAHGCSGGDTEALHERMIPQLRAIVAAAAAAGD